MEWMDETSVYLINQTRTAKKKKKKREWGQNVQNTNTTQGLEESWLQTERPVFTTGMALHGPATWFYILQNYYSHSSIECETKKLKRIKKYIIHL